MCKYIATHENEILEVRELAAKFTVDVVSNVIFGIDAQSFETENSQIREMAKGLFTFTPLFRFYITMSTLFPVILKTMTCSLVPKTVNVFFQRLMNEALKYRKLNKIDRLDFLDYLSRLQEKKGVDENVLTAHGVAFFLDGFETSSVVMGYALYELAKHKDVQNKLRNDIFELLNTKEHITFDDILELPYLEQVFAEVIRLHPIMAVLARKCTETTTLLDAENDISINIDKGMTVLIPYYSIHMDESYYPDPLKFDPERFSSEKGGTKAYKEKGIYMPFGDGQRMCLGMRFGTAQLKMGILEIIRRFEIDVDEKTKEPLKIDPSQFLLCTLGGIWLKFKVI